jgi:hypothetical protein
MLRAAFLFLAIAAGLPAQEPSPVVQRAIQRIVAERAFPSVAPSVAPAVVSPEFKAPPKVCSVPLTSAKIPDNVHFTMRLAPPAARTAPMPMTSAMPPCDVR